MRAFERLSEFPVGWGGICRHHMSAVAGGDDERQGLAYQVSAGLPVLTPIACHLNPRICSPPDGNRRHISGAGHVGHQYQVEPGIPIDGEPDPSTLDAWNPAKKHTCTTIVKFMYYNRLSAATEFVNVRQTKRVSFH